MLLMTNGIVNHNGGTSIALSKKKKQRRVKTTHKAIQKEILVAAVVDQIHLDIEKEEVDTLRMLVEYNS